MINQYCILFNGTVVGRNFSTPEAAAEYIPVRARMHNHLVENYIVGKVVPMKKVTKLVEVTEWSES